MIYIQKHDKVQSNKSLFKYAQDSGIIQKDVRLFLNSHEERNKS